MPDVYVRITEAPRPVLDGLMAALELRAADPQLRAMLTAYLTDARNGPTFSKVRTEMFPDRNFPASAQITVSNLAVPGMLIEIHAVAVIGDKCSKANPCIPR